MRRFQYVGTRTGLCIPGDTITAIVIGMLYVKGMNPGPTLFMFNPQTIYAVFLSSSGEPDHGSARLGSSSCRKTSCGCPSRC